jgi:hypothetical protein
MALKAAMWVHGNIVEVQLPALVFQGRFDWGTKYSALRDRHDNWFHFSMPTPVIVDDIRPPLVKIFVFYNAEFATIREVRARDGPREVKRFDNLNLTGDHSFNIDSSNSWVIDPPITILFGLGISLRATISPDVESPPRGLIFTTAGADFRSP